MSDRDMMWKAWNAPITSFIREVENWQGNTLNPEYFSPNDLYKHGQM